MKEWKRKGGGILGERKVRTGNRGLKVEAGRGEGKRTWKRGEERILGE